MKLDLVQIALYSFVVSFLLWWFLGHLGIVTILALGLLAYLWWRKSST